MVDLIKKTYVKIVYRKIIESTSLTVKEFQSLINEKKKTLKGLPSYEEILYLIAKELGVEIFQFGTKNDFVTFLKKKLHESPESFKDEAFPLILDVIENPEFKAIIKKEVLKEEIEIINNFDKLGKLSGQVAYLYPYESIKDPDLLWISDPEAYLYCFNQTIMNSGIYKLYFFDVWPEIWVAGTESAENAVNLVIYDQINSEIMKKKNIQDLLYSKITDLYDSEITELYEYLPYEDCLNTQIAKALKYLEVKMFFTRSLGVIEIEKEDLKLDPETVFWEEKRRIEVIKAAEETFGKVNEDIFYQNLIAQRDMDEKLIGELKETNDSYISNIYKELTNALYSEDLSDVIKVLKAQEFDRFIGVINTEPKNYLAVIEGIIDGIIESGFFNIDIWAMERKLNDYELNLIKKFKLIIENWENFSNSN